jgi:hypothetical protein
MKDKNVGTEHINAGLSRTSDSVQIRHLGFGCITSVCFRVIPWL